MNNATAVRTPFGQLACGIILGQITFTMTMIIPLSLLLTLKIVEIDPENVAANMSMAAGTSSVVGVFAGYLGGVVSDRTTLTFGRRRTWILAGFLSAAACLIALGATRDVDKIVIYWCLAVFCLNFSSTSVVALIPDQVEEGRRGTISGLIGQFIPIGMVSGMGLMTLLNNLPIAAKFNVIAGIAAVGSIICCLLVKDSPARRNVTNEVQEKHTIGELLGKLYPSPRKYPAFSWGVLNRFLLSAAFASQMLSTLYLIQKFNISPDAVTEVAALNMTLQMVVSANASFLGGVISDMFRKQKPFVVGSALVVAIGILMLTFAPSLAYVYIGNAILGIGMGIYAAVDMALNSRILPSTKDAAKDFGIMNIIGVLAQPLVMAIASPVLAWGGFTVFYGGLAMAGILSALAVIPIPEMSPVSFEELVDTCGSNFSN
ncbi:MAG: major facilitator superfamily 1 [Firmicutes bacterium]|nr:major facilitator superfamily 1 [Bacillota bacterium]